jgi:uncharacterized membrane-anchored protein YhcB (DUF1043 family)
MISLIVGLLLGGVAVFFAFQNNDIITVRFLENELTGSVALIIIAALLVGFVIGMIILLPVAIADSWKAKSLQREVDKLKKRLGEEPIQYEAPGLGEQGDKHIEIVNEI